MAERAPVPGEGARALRHGPGRMLVAVYGVFAISASARAGYQLLARFDQAPVAYSLSAVAAGVYLVAAAALAVATERARVVAVVAVLLELVGVVVVGALTATGVLSLGDQSVWSGFGSGYGYVPAVLPVLGLWWLRRAGRARSGPHSGPHSGGRLRP